MYQHKTEPFPHQDRLLEDTWDRESYGILWEQGTGKSKPVIDTAARLYEAGRIDTVVTLAPNGVHRNWITDELPAHMPDRVATRMHSMFWRPGQMDTIAGRALARSIAEYRGLSWISMSYDHIMTEQGRDFLWRLFRKRGDMLYAADESHNIKTPNAKRTKRTVASAKYAAFRRILTGTPVSQGAFDTYSQIKFLEQDFWKQFGMADFAAFKAHFGEWETGKFRDKNGNLQEYPKLLGYKRLEELREIISTLTDRVLKEDVLDLPPKLYAKQWFDMTPKQRRIYNQLKEDYRAELGSGATVTAVLPMVRLLRLQQITCGYVPTDGDEEQPTELIDKKNPRLDSMVAATEGVGTQGIIWSRFTKDIDLLVDALPRAVRYDGAISDDECERSKQIFKAGDAQWFVGNQQKGGSGLTLNEAKWMSYYANSFRFIDRRQSEDRPHRIGQDVSVLVTDSMCSDCPTDTGIIQSMRDKYDISNKLTGDQLREWL